MIGGKRWLGGHMIPPAAGAPTYLLNTWWGSGPNSGYYTLYHNSNIHPVSCTDNPESTDTQAKSL